MKAMRPVIASNEVPYIQMRSVGSHSTSGMKKEGTKEMTGWEYNLDRKVVNKFGSSTGSQVGR